MSAKSSSWEASEASRRLFRPFAAVAKRTQNSAIWPYYSGPFEHYENVLANSVKWDVDGILDALGPIHGEIIEIGCGGGRVTVPLLTRGYRVVAIDSSSDAIHRLKSRLQSCEPLTGSASVICQDFLCWNGAGSAYSAVVLSDLSINIFGYDAACKLLERMRAILIAGGLFICGVFSEAGRKQLCRYDGSPSGSLHAREYIDEDARTRLMWSFTEYVPLERTLSSSWFVDMDGAHIFKRYNLAHLEERIWITAELEPLALEFGFHLRKSKPYALSGGGMDGASVELLVFARQN